MRISDWSSDVCSSDLPFFPWRLRRHSSRGKKARRCRPPASLRAFGCGRGSPGHVPSHRGRDGHGLENGKAISWLPSAPSRKPPTANMSATSSRSAFRPKGSISEEHTSELQSLMRNSYAVFCLKKKNTHITHTRHITTTHMYHS